MPDPGPRDLKRTVNRSHLNELNAPDRDNGQAVEDTFSVLQFNMWGWIGYHGGNEIAHATARYIREARPAVATFNEACLGQVRTIAEDLDSAGLSYQFHHDFILRRESDGRSCDFGNAIMWLGEQKADREPERFLPVPRGEQPRKVLAVKVDVLRLPTVLCTTHLTSGLRMKRVRRQQVLEVAEYIAMWKLQGYEVLLGGDFNEQPNSAVLDPMYLPGYGRGSSGICHEASSDGAPAPRLRRRPFEGTFRFGRKYDYIFMTAGYEPRGATVSDALSDHHPYLATIL